MDELEDDKQAQADFDSGIEAETLPPAKPAAEVKPPAVEPAKVEPKPQAQPTVEAKPAPKYVQITEDQYRRLEEVATKVGTLDSKFDKAFGTVGDMQQVVKKLQAATPAGMSIEIPKDAFAEMAKDFPELAAHFQTGLDKVLKNVRGTAPSTATAPDSDAIQKLIDAGVTAATRRNEEAALNDTYSNWREIVGTVDNEGRHDPNNEFRKWLTTQDVGYQHLINSTDSSQIISRAIGKFLQFKSAAPKPTVTAPHVAARQNRIAAAVQPKGDGGQPSPSKSADDEFNAGFATG